MTELAFFEDAIARHFKPLTWTRPVYELRCGVFTIREKFERLYGRPATRLYARPHLTLALAERTGLPVNLHPTSGMVLLINGRWLPPPDVAQRIPLDGDEHVWVDEEGVVVAARLRADRLRALSAVTLGEDLHADPNPLGDLPTTPIAAEMLAWPWDLVVHNAAQIEADAAFYPLGTLLGAVHERAVLVAPERIFVAEGATIAPQVVLDATHGPIIIEAGAQVMANAVIEGPAVVGARSRVKIGAKIYEGTTIGPVCKVGGEVETSIFQAYSNKQHDGFLGHSVIGEWCNLGAHTTNSDLKNNYSRVRVWASGRFVDTGQQFVGCFIGDHTKTGIGLLINTGSVFGVACNLYGATMPPKFVPSFSWGTGSRLVEYRLEQALETAARVMARRNKTLTQAEADLLTYIFAATREERRYAAVVEQEA
ncbi:hypothetical protein ARMA_0704 [Ardenticatena maritima]|uniref:Glucose-1-phosphate thymidylyltransferase n=1 Tax=Ardenticatena maritima TaxID=872965 RepID=A0A0M8K7C7_9CHLR|nr:GlmU family protein [Ardenticatena maritima]KPL86442.1 hypothetical protein SE16_14215 [Ardenticatena maritima]GAP62281.1 hypothetical protein ARMA_0704 [Ardenticatena maritima]